MSEPKIIPLDQAFENLNKKARIFKNVFSTGNGKVILQALKDEFDAMEIRDNDPYNTYYNLGRRDVVKYIEQMMNHTEKKESKDART